MAHRQILLRIGVAVAAAAFLVAPHTLWWHKQRTVSRSGNLYRRTCDAIAAIPSASGASGYFVDVTDSLGLDFEHLAGPPGSYFLPEINGAGGALFDFDGDGDLDLFLVGSGRSPRARGDFPAGARPGNRLYRQDRAGSFSDVTEGSGLEDSGYGVGCAVGDVDNDGDLDIYVTAVGPDKLYRNNGNGTFSDISTAAGIEDNDYGTCAAFVDFDRDGWLDLIVANYVHDPLYGLSVACNYGSGQVTYCGPRKFIPTDSRLYRNVGRDEGGQSAGVRFTDVTAAAGLSKTPGAGFGVVCADFNRDGLPDLYIANDLYANRMWINRGNGTFADEAVARGAAYNGKGDAQASMGMALGDVNGDGALDLLSTHFAEETGTFYLNDGGGYFTDATDAAGITGPTRLHTGWGAAFLDLDHDGHLDLVLVNGSVIPCHLVRSDYQQVQEVHHDVIPDPQAFWEQYVDRNLLLMNRGRGRFEDQSARGGDFCTKLASGRALIYGDIDNDGDLDLVVTSCGGRTRVFRNDFPKRGHWLQIRAFHPALRRDALGAEITIEAGDRRFLALVQPASSYLASNDLRVHVGLGPASRYESATVRWPDGQTEVFAGGAADRLVLLEWGAGRPLTEDGP